MTSQELKEKTKKFALNILELVEMLPNGKGTDVIARQLLRSATSIGANYRAACRAKSQADFIAKIAVVEEEADESLYWLELLLESGACERTKIKNLMREADELTAIFTASGRTAKRKSV